MISISEVYLIESDISPRGDLYNAQLCQIDPARERMKSNNEQHGIFPVTEAAAFAVLCGEVENVTPIKSPYAPPFVATRQEAAAMRPAARRALAPVFG